MTRNDLELFKTLNAQLKRKKEELRDLRLGMNNISSPGYSERFQNGTRIHEAGFERSTDRCMQLEEEIRQETFALFQKKHEIINAIHRVPSDRLSEILYQHYIKFVPLTKLADQEGIDRDNMYKLHKKALLILENDH